MSSLTRFHSETLPAGQICQSKQDRINIISVQCVHSFTSPPLSPRLSSGIRANGPLLGIHLLWGHWIFSQPWFCPCAVIFSLRSLGMSELCKLCITLHCCVCWSIIRRHGINAAVLISFYRTVNNFLMTGPKVNTFCPRRLFILYVDVPANASCYVLDAITNNKILFSLS